MTVWDAEKDRQAVVDAAVNMARRALAMCFAGTTKVPVEEVATLDCYGCRMSLTIRADFDEAHDQRDSADGAAHPKESAKVMTEPRVSDEQVGIVIAHHAAGGRGVVSYAHSNVTDFDLAHDLRDCRAALAATQEYLADICNAYEAWKAAKNDPEDEDGTNPEHVAWNALTDALDAACEGRQEP